METGPKRPKAKPKGGTIAAKEARTAKSGPGQRARGRTAATLAAHELFADYLLNSWSSKASESLDQGAARFERLVGTAWELARECEMPKRSGPGSEHLRFRLNEDRSAALEGSDPEDTFFVDIVRMTRPELLEVCAPLSQDLAVKIGLQASAVAEQLRQMKADGEERERGSRKDKQGKDTKSGRTSDGARERLARLMRERGVEPAELAPLFADWEVRKMEDNTRELKSAREAARETARKRWRGNLSTYKGRKKEKRTANDDRSRS